MWGSYYLYTAVILSADCQKEKNVHHFRVSFTFLQPKSVLLTTRKQDFRDSRKVHCNENHPFLLAKSDLVIFFNRWIL